MDNTLANNQFDIQYLNRRLREMDKPIEIDSILCGYKGGDMWDTDYLFPDYPPADPIVFNMAKLHEPNLTYDEFLRRWRAKTIELRKKPQA